MARIWQEGFECGFPHGQYLEGNPLSNFINGLSLPSFPVRTSISTGRNAYSQYSLKISAGGNELSQTAIYTLDSSLSELYFRIYYKATATGSGSLYTLNEIISLYAGSNPILSIRENGTSTTAYKIYARVGGSYASVLDITLSLDTWHKIEFYIKIDSSTGAYNVKINDSSMISDSGIDTGSTNIDTIRFGTNGGSLGNAAIYVHFDDIAINDTTGSKNNSWCGDGTIIGLKPKAAGNYSQFSTSQGWALGESGTSTTNVKITGHGLSDNDVIYNVTRDAYRIVTVVDPDNLTVSSVTNQTDGDTFVGFANADTIVAGSGTTTSMVRISGHTLESYDVIVNTTRSNAIRRIIYVNGTDCYNSYTLNAEYTGSTVTSQTSGDSIKTFKVKYFTISDHYKTVNQSSPNPQYANVQSSTADQIDSYDMQELVADKGLSANINIIAISHGVYVKEKGAGSQFKPFFRIDGSDYAGDTKTINGGTFQYNTIYEDSPATSTAFTLAEVDGLEAGVKVV